MAKPVKVWLPAFMRFCELVRITSKEAEHPVPIVPYEGQKRFLRALTSGLDEDTHHFTVLKSRQLGISTILLALDIFWLYMHPGLQGALIADTADNKDILRGTITEMLASLPPRYRVPIKSHNRNALVLANGSRLQYMNAGKQKNSGLGRSRALNFVHATECSSWGDQKGLDSLRHALAQENPNRLYVFESTALGYNLFFDMWEDAKADTRQKAIFIGWWSKDNQRISEDSEEFARWWGERPVLDEDEEKVAVVVAKEYGWTITPEQWAWHRRASATAGDEASFKEEQPSTEYEAFQATGNSFFSLRRVTADIDLISRAGTGYTGYRYTLGSNFLKMQVEETRIPDEVDLRVWEEPIKDAKYVLGVDPAYGRDDDKDRSCISVWRCFADKMIQVAEYTTPIPTTRQVAWVMCHLAGCYRDCMINLEVTGPGSEVMMELDNLRQQLAFGALRDVAPSLNPGFALDQARWYLYHRPDSMGPGYMYNWKAVATDTPIPTPTGWTTMGEVKAGDTVLGADGLPTEVIGVSEVQYDKRCMRVTFDDGTSVVAAEDHRWLVNRPHWAVQQKGRSAPVPHKIRTTSQLVAGKHRIKAAAPLGLPAADLPIHPYTLGVWLGDGCSTSATIYGAQADLEEIAGHLESCGETVLPPRKSSGETRARTIRGLVPRLRAAGLLGNKHIPDVYLRASYEQRLALLQGLMDTDGGQSGNHGQQSGWTTTTDALAKGFSELVRSLGMKAKLCRRDRTLRYKGVAVSCATAQQFWFTPPQGMVVYRLARKAALQARDGGRAYRQGKWHRILSVEEVDTVPVKCLAVANADHLFLVGDGMVPTHNTSFENKQRLLNRMRDNYDTEGLIVRSIPLLNEMVTFVYDNGKLKASGRNKDDRVMAAALAGFAWVEWIRPGMMVQSLTYENEIKKEAERSLKGGRVIDWIVPMHFENQARIRAEADLQRFLES